MGGCCCGSSKGAAAQFNSSPPYYYYPRSSEEHVPLSSHNAAASVPSTGLLVDTNLDTSVPDAYRPPPAPMPFDVALGPPQTPERSRETCGEKNDGALPTTNSASRQDDIGLNSQETLAKCVGARDLDCKEQINSELDSAKELEIELSKSVESLVSAMEEEDCPICLEEYDLENPKLTTKCEHHFHLSCILEWMERSESCPVCDKEMIIDPPVD